MLISFTFNQIQIMLKSDPYQTRNTMINFINKTLKYKHTSNQKPLGEKEIDFLDGIIKMVKDA